MRVVVPGETKSELKKRKLDVALDEELENTFPASDPLKITRNNPERPIAPKPKSFRSKTK